MIRTEPDMREFYWNQEKDEDDERWDDPARFPEYFSDPKPSDYANADDYDSISMLTAAHLIKYAGMVIPDEDIRGLTYNFQDTCSGVISKGVFKYIREHHFPIIHSPDLNAEQIDYLKRVCRAILVSPHGSFIAKAGYEEISMMLTCITDRDISIPYGNQIIVKQVLDILKSIRTDQTLIQDADFHKLQTLLCRITTS